MHLLFCSLSGKDHAVFSGVTLLQSDGTKGVLTTLKYLAATLSEIGQKWPFTCPPVYCISDPNC